MAEKENNVIGTRANQDMFEAVRSIVPDTVYYPVARIISVQRKRPTSPKSRIAVITAGTSDMPVAEEAAITAELLGNNVLRIYDAGVAGIHRLVDSFLINLERLKEHVPITVIDWTTDAKLPDLSDYELILDGLFGSGLSRPLSGFAAQLVKHLNNSEIPILSIDIPSGLMGEDNRENDPDAIIRASNTLTFEFPKLSFFYRESEQYVGRWEVVPIGWHPDGIGLTGTPWYFSDQPAMAEILKCRGKFSHKGTFGHALLVAGSYGKIGAAILAARGCLRSGVGLLTVHLPRVGNQIMQTAVPEAMVSFDESENLISYVELSPAYKAVGIGPGIGKSTETVNSLRWLLTNYHAPMVIDADALNILSEHSDMVQLVPADSILTPHPVEFERLAGHAQSDFERLTLARTFAQAHHLILILKGAFTAIALPDGNCWFNSTRQSGDGHRRQRRCTYRYSDRFACSGL